MAHRIDRIALWMFAALSAFLLMLSLTGGSIPLSMLTSFIAVFLLRMLLQRFMPEKKRISRKKRIQQIERLIYRWALADEALLKSDLTLLLPDLTDKTILGECTLIQRLPQEAAFSSNELLDLWRSHKGRNPPPHRLHILMTCALSETAKRILPALSAPCIEITDKNDLMRMLLKSFDRLPAEDCGTAKKEQRRPIRDHAALFVQNIRPLRVGMYICFFAAMYLLTGAMLYLISGILYTALLAAYLLSKHLVRQ